MTQAIQEIIIDACSGKSFDVKKGQYVTVVDVEGGQVADFFAENAANPREFLSLSVTTDCLESLCFHEGDSLYSTLYNPMFVVVEDKVGKHDMLFPCCRPEMYDFFFQNGKGHSNCFDNINNSLGENRPIIQPINLFMYTTVGSDGKITIHPPLSKSGDRIVLQAMMDVRIGISACSVSEGSCNGYKCKPIKVVISEAL